MENFGYQPRGIPPLLIWLRVIEVRLRVQVRTEDFLVSVDWVGSAIWVGLPGGLQEQVRSAHPAERDLVSQADSATPSSGPWVICSPQASQD
jgi:hypothetical protein